MLRQHNTKRKSKKRTRKPVLVVAAEGKNVTELQYIMSFQNQHGKYVIHPHRTGHDTDPSGLLKSIEKYWNDNQLSKDLGDKAYILLDIDCKEDRLDQIKEKMRGAKFAEFILSNPCFEIWFLLHYDYTAHVFKDGNEVIQQLRRFIPDYEKSLDISEELRPNLRTAFENSRKLKAYHKHINTWPSAMCNPMTDADLVIMDINNYE